MRNYIQDNKKKLMAIFGVILMIAFVLPSSFNPNSGSNSKRLFGYADGRKIFSSDIERARQQWEIIDNVIMLSPERTGPGREISLGEALRQQDPAFRSLADQMANHPELFYLLQVEAENMGINVPANRVDTLFKQAGLTVRLQTSARPIVELENVTDPNYAAAVRDAAAAFMKITDARDRAVSTVKVSLPLRRRAIERQLQQLQVSAVELNAKDFLANLPSPTQQQLQEQFDRFAEFEPEAPNSEKNPHGFGYKYPNRVTLQYIGVRREDVRAVVRASKSDYDWDVEAQKYYLRHASEFPTTQPELPPTTAPSTGPSTQPDASKNVGAGATTRPFAEVREEIVDKLMAPEIQRRAREAQDRVSARLTEDWTKWHAKNPPSTSPTTSPATTPDAALSMTAPTTVPSTQPQGYPSFEYLQQLAADVQKQTGVLPVIASVNQFQTAKELSAIPGIGLSFAGQFPFAQYAAELSADVLPAADRNNKLALQRHQPSQLLKDTAGSTYVFRTTGGLPASKPQSMTEVAEAVERDWRVAQAFDLAKKRAQELMSAAATSGSLEAAANAAGLKSVLTGTFGESTPTITGIDLDDTATTRFRSAAMDLLSIAATQSSTQPATQPVGETAPPPLKLIELPVQQKVFVTQLISAKPSFDLKYLSNLDARAEAELGAEAAAPIVQRWYNFDNVAARVKWKDETGRGSDNGDGG